MSIKKIGEDFLEITGIGAGTISGNLTVEGTVHLPSTTTLGDTNLLSTIDLKANSASPTLTGTVTANNATSVLLPALTVVQYDGTPLRDTLALKANNVSPLLSGNVGIGTTNARVALDIVSTSAILAPAGTTAQRPAGVKGLLRYNTTDDAFEGYTGSWGQFGILAGVADVSITSCTSSDSWIITTNNSSGTLSVNVTLASTPANNVRLSSAFSTSTNTFKIVLINATGVPITMNNTYTSLEYNIVLSRNGGIVNSGRYSFALNGTVIKIGSIITSIYEPFLTLWYDPGYGLNGSSLIDLSGYGRTGTLQGGASVNSNSQIVLNGSPQYISTTYMPNLNNNTLYTFELWFWDDAPGGFLSNTALISNYGPDGTTPLATLHIIEDGKVAFNQRTPENQGTGITTPLSVCNSTWNHIVGVATETDLILYVNGINVVSSATRMNGTITSNMSIVIGGNHLGRYQTCRLGPIRIYVGVALSESQVLQNYNSEKNRSELKIT